MINRERRNDRKPGFNVGSASIIMVFAVLCLTIFSVLSFTTTSTDLRLSRRASKSIADFYIAEYKAEEKVLQISQQLKKDGNLDNLRLQSGDFDLDAKEYTIQFTEPVDDRRMLLVELTFDADNTITITRWNLLASGDWFPSSSIDVWGGN